MLAHAETAFRPWMRYGGVLLSALELDPSSASWRSWRSPTLEGSEYEWAQHVGITWPSAAPRNRSRRSPKATSTAPRFDERQSAVLQVTRAVVKDGSATEEQVLQLAALIGARQVVELLLVIGQYLSIARLIATLGIPPDPPAIPSSLTPDAIGDDEDLSGVSEPEGVILVGDRNSWHLGRSAASSTATFTPIAGSIPPPARGPRCWRR